MTVAPFRNSHLNNSVKESDRNSDETVATRRTVLCALSGYIRSCA